MHIDIKLERGIFQSEAGNLIASPDLTFSDFKESFRNQIDEVRIDQIRCSSRFQEPVTIWGRTFHLSHLWNNDRLLELSMSFQEKDLKLFKQDKKSFERTTLRWICQESGYRFPVENHLVTAKFGIDPSYLEPVILFFYTGNIAACS